MSAAIDPITAARLGAFVVKRKRAAALVASIDPHAADAALFATEQLGIHLDDWQRGTLRSQPKRSLWNVARQGGKSTVAAVKALHRSHYVPNSLILMVSPSQRQSAELFRKWRDLLRRMEHPPTMQQDTTTSATLGNGSRVISLPSSEDTVRGYSSVDLLIFDEASRVPDELYHACRPMVAVSDGDILGMSTPWGKRGWWYEAWQIGPPWQRVEVPATECPRISAAFLDEERQSKGPWWFAQEYECVFGDTEDSLFSTDDLDAALSYDIVPLPALAFGGRDE